MCAPPVGFSKILVRIGGLGCNQFLGHLITITAFHFKLCGNKKCKYTSLFIVKVIGRKISILFIFFQVAVNLLQVKQNNQTSSLKSETVQTKLKRQIPQLFNQL